MTVIVCNELAILQNFEMVALKTWNRSATMVINGNTMGSVYNPSAYTKLLAFRVQPKSH